MDSHPYAKFIHAENQDILWGLYQKATANIDIGDIFKREMRNYYTSKLVSSGKSCSTVRELFEINRDALAYLLNAHTGHASGHASGHAFGHSSGHASGHSSGHAFGHAFGHALSIHEVPIGINVVEEKKRQQEMQQDRFSSFTTEYHQLLARPAPKPDATMTSSNAPNDEKIKNMDELLEQQMQARKEDERRIAAFMKPPSKVQEKPKQLKIDYGTEKTVSWDPMIDVEVVNI
jgi:hypothetical protein